MKVETVRHKQFKEHIVDRNHFFSTTNYLRKSLCGQGFHLEKLPITQKTFDNEAAFISNGTYHLCKSCARSFGL